VRRSLRLFESLLNKHHHSSSASRATNATSLLVTKWGDRSFSTVSTYTKSDDSAISNSESLVNIIRTEFETLSEADRSLLQFRPLRTTTTLTKTPLSYPDFIERINNTPSTSYFTPSSKADNRLSLQEFLDGIHRAPNQFLALVLALIQSTISLSSYITDFYCYIRRKLEYKSLHA